MDLDLKLLTERPTAIIDESSAKERSFHKTWERLNRLSIMFMQMTVANNIKSTILKTEKAKEYMEFVKSELADRSLAGALIGTLTTCKFDGTHTMHQHVTEMIDTTAKLRYMGMEVSESFLVQFIINSLPSEYGAFEINYNTIKNKLNINEL